MFLSSEEEIERFLLEASGQLEEKSSVPKIFKHEKVNLKVGNIIVREIKILDQYGPHYAQSIAKYKTPSSICGYVVCAVAPLVSEWANYMICQPEDVDKMIENLRDPKVMIPKVEEAMEIIQAQRTLYVEEYGDEFANPKERDFYIKDWVANYEISDLLQITSPNLKNLFFLRYCAFSFPEEVKKVKHEELRRLKEEEAFKGNRFIVESFYNERRLQTVDDWIREGHMEKLAATDKPLVFVGDLAGHFVTFVLCKVLKEDGTLEDNLLMINSTQTNYLNREETFKFFDKLVSV